jgi:hypothetical protein
MCFCLLFLTGQGYLLQSYNRRIFLCTSFNNASSAAPQIPRCRGDFSVMVIIKRRIPILYSFCPSYYFFTVPIYMYILFGPYFSFVIFSYFLFTILRYPSEPLLLFPSPLSLHFSSNQFLLAHFSVL